jgi:hypothetical protein
MRSIASVLEYKSVIAELPTGEAATLTLSPGLSRSGVLSCGRPVAACFVSMLLAEVVRTPNPESSAMTVHAPKLLTPEEFASLIEVAVTSPNPTIPASHLAKLVSFGYVLMTAKGPVVTGDGLIRITESE